MEINSNSVDQNNINHTQKESLNQENYKDEGTFRERLLSTSFFHNDGLNQKMIWAFGVGHYINDLMAAQYMFFFLIFLKQINPIDDSNPGHYAGIITLIGQIADSTFYPIIGFLSDKTNTRIGQRKPWYIFGLILNFFTYINLFQKCTLCSLTGINDLNTRLTNYVILILFFNMGYGSLQISHLSLVPSITHSKERRDRLYTLRNAFSYFANMSVLLSALIIFPIFDDPILAQQVLTYTCLIFGGLASAFFLNNINEVNLRNHCVNYTSEVQNSVVDEETMPLYKWFLSPTFYQYGFAYMCVRLNYMILNTMINFYVLHVLNMGSADAGEKMSFEIALIPLLINFSSTLTSYYVNRLFLYMGRKNSYSLGFACNFLTATTLYLMNDSTSGFIYPLAIFIGVGQSICYNTGVSFIADVVGKKGKSGAVVFGFYGLLDKMSYGIAVYVIFSQQLFEINDTDFIKNITVFVPIIACFIGSVLIQLGEETYKQE